MVSSDANAISSGNVRARARTDRRSTHHLARSLTLKRDRGH